MIISRTPLRMSFVGGGSDLPTFYRKFGGAVVSTAIDKFVYVTVNKKFDEAIRISYSKTEEVQSIDQIEHKLVRETMRRLKMPGGVEITSVADIPAKGTGLGSSSAFTVGLLNALNAYNRNFASAETLASEASAIEIDICGEPIGKQDQYAAAYGGLNFIQFNQDDSVYVDPIICQRETLQKMRASVVTFYTGNTRSASTLLKAQSEAVENDAAKQDVLKKMVRLAFDLREKIQQNNLDTFGEILHENWLLKKSITGQVSNPQIDDWYDRAMKAGARGGKLLGAGAGGFLMFFASPDKHESITQALKELRRVKFDLESQGSKIIFVH